MIHSSYLIFRQHVVFDAIDSNERLGLCIVKLWLANGWNSQDRQEKEHSINVCGFFFDFNLNGTQTIR